MTQELFDKLLESGEGKTIDFKEKHYFEKSSSHQSDAKDKDSEFIKDLLAFSNTIRDESAYILIGVKEDSSTKKGIAVGIDTSDTIDSSNLQSKVRSKVTPGLVFSCRKFIDKNGKHFEIIEIPIVAYPSPCVSVITRGGLLVKDIVYLRADSQNAEAKPFEVYEIFNWLKSISSLKKISELESLPFLSLDLSFVLEQDLQQIKAFLAKCDLNLKNNKTPFGDIIFSFEKILVHELSLLDGKIDSHTENIKTNIQLCLNKINEIKMPLLGQIELLLTQFIYYNLDSRENQAIVVRSLIYAMKQSGSFEEMYSYAIASANLELKNLKLWDSLISQMSSIKEDDIFLAGTHKTQHTKIDIFNNFFPSPINYSVFLNEKEMEELKDNLNNDKILGKSGFEIMKMFPSSDFDVTVHMPLKTILEKVIPTAIQKAYYSSTSEKTNEDIVKNYLNIGVHHLGIG